MAAMRSNSDETEQTAGEMIRFGTVAEVDLEGGRVVVDVGDVQTGPVRWLSGRAGATRTWSPPSVGEQLLLLAPDGDMAGAVALLGAASDHFPPAGNSLRELFSFGDGAEIAYDPEAHALEALLPEGATVKIVAAGGVTIDASDGGLTIKGDVEIDGEIHATGDIGSDGDVVAGEISLQQHRHGGVAAGGSLTEAAQ